MSIVKCRWLIMSAPSRAVSDAERTVSLEAHAKAVKQHIDSLSAKDYANLPGVESPDFVLMFMPVEPAYIEVMRSQRELFNLRLSKECGAGVTYDAHADPAHGG